MGIYCLSGASKSIRYDTGGLSVCKKSGSRQIFWGMVLCTDGGMLYIGHVFNGSVYDGVKYHYTDCIDCVRDDYAVSCKKGTGEKRGKIKGKGMGLSDLCQPLSYRVL